MVSPQAASLPVLAHIGSLSLPWKMPSKAVGLNSSKPEVSKLLSPKLKLITQIEPKK